MSRAALAFALTATLSAAGPALAECPAGRSAGVQGVVIDFGENIRRYHLRDDGTTFETDYATDGSYVWEYLTHPSGLVLESWEIVTGRVVPENTELVTYDGGIPSLPQPVTGMAWNSFQMATYGNGDVVRSAVSIEIAPSEPYVIGACSYDSLPITVRRLNVGDNDLYFDRLVYLSDLGIVLFLGGASAGETPVLSQPISIGFFPPIQDGGTPVSPTVPRGGLAPAAAPVPVPVPVPVTPPLPAVK